MNRCCVEDNNVNVCSSGAEFGSFTNWLGESSLYF